MIVYYLDSEVLPYTKLEIERMKSKARAEARRERQRRFRSMEQQVEELELYKSKAEYHRNAIACLEAELKTAKFWRDKWHDRYCGAVGEILQEIDQHTEKDLDYIVIDIDTTGLHGEVHEILRLSIVTTGEVIHDRFYNAFASSWRDAEEVNGISKESVDDKPYVHEDLVAIQTAISRAKTVVCFNIAFVRPFLNAIGIITPVKVYDVMQHFSKLFGPCIFNGHMPYQSLKECAEYYGYTWGEDIERNSLEDALAIRHCYRCLTSYDRGVNIERVTQDLLGLYKDLATYKCRVDIYPSDTFIEYKYNPDTISPVLITLEGEGKIVNITATNTLSVVREERPTYVTFIDDEGNKLTADFSIVRTKRHLIHPEDAAVEQE